MINYLLLYSIFMKEFYNYTNFEIYNIYEIKNIIDDYKKQFENIDYVYTTLDIIDQLIYDFKYSNVKKNALKWDNNKLI